MFINTIAVGPLELVASWVTGCTAVARHLNWRCECVKFHRAGAESELNAGAATACDALLDSWHVEYRSAIATDRQDHSVRWLDKCNPHENMGRRQPDFVGKQVTQYS